MSKNRYSNSDTENELRAIQAGTFDPELVSYVPTADTIDAWVARGAAYAPEPMPPMPEPVPVNPPPKPLESPDQAQPDFEPLHAFWREIGSGPEMCDELSHEAQQGMIGNSNGHIKYERKRAL